MIQFSATIISLLQDPVINAFYMVKIDTYLSTTHISNITLSNGETYLADGKLLNVDTPRLSATVDRELYKVIFADPDYAIGNAMQTGIVGKNFEVRIGFINNTTNEPYNNISDTVLAYKGKVDNMSYSIDSGDVGEVVLAITGASPMADLDSTKAFYTSKEYIRGLYPTDSCFDQIYEGSGPINLKWGKG
jgi:hypothetical protein